MEFRSHRLQTKVAARNRVQRRKAAELRVRATLHRYTALHAALSKIQHSRARIHRQVALSRRMAELARERGVGTTL